MGIAAGVFVLMALAMFMHGIAWLLNHLFFSGDVYAGFLIEADLGGQVEGYGKSRSSLSEQKFVTSV